MKNTDRDAAVERFNDMGRRDLCDAFDQLGDLQSLARQQREQPMALPSVDLACNLVSQHFKAGRASCLSVRSAGRHVLTRRRVAVDLRGCMRNHHIALIGSLGGGYAADPEALADMTRGPAE